MLIFAHIFAGTVLGLVLWRIIGDRRFIPVCIVGSILPDLIDKPLGLTIFPQALDNARTFSHTLLFVGIITAIALIVWRSRRTLLILGLAGAVLLHQILDEMWHEPVTWFFPLGGIFQTRPEVNFYVSYFWLEITSLPEWIFLFSTLVLLLLVYSNRLPGPLNVSIQKWKTPLLCVVKGLLCILGVYSLICAGTGMRNLVAPYNNPENNLILGLVALAGCAILIKIPVMQVPAISGKTER
ncbi:MAG: metal-dependent hydrolase [Methanoregula sp.]